MALFFSLRDCKNTEEFGKHLETTLAKTKKPRKGAFKWYQLESNQRHMDFQSIALPTELPSHTQNRFDYIEKRGKITWSTQQNKNI